MVAGELLEVSILFFFFPGVLFRKSVACQDEACGTGLSDERGAEGGTKGRGCGL